MKYRDPATGLIPENIRQLEQTFAQTLLGAFSRKNEGEDIQAFGTWQSRGPWNIGGRTRAFAFDANNFSTLLAGAVSGGVWMSTNDGISWSLTTAPNQLHSVTCIAQDTQIGKRNIWYYGTGEIYGNSAQISGNGVWKSVDSGRTWTVLTQTASPTTPASNAFAYTWRIVCHPKRADEVYLSTARSGLYKSTNGGTTWTVALGSNALFGDVTVTPNGTLYAAFSASTGSAGSVSSRWGVYRSEDGIKWVNVTPPEMNTKLERVVLAPVPQNADQIFILASTPDVGARGMSTLRGQFVYEWHSLWQYTHVSGDGTGSGGRIENRSANIPLFPIRRGDFYSQGGYDLFVSASQFDSNLVVVGGTNVYRSTDGFTTTSTNTWIGGYGKTSTYWDRYSLYPEHHPDQHGAAFHPQQPATMISFNDGGVMRTDDVRAAEVAWKQLNNGYLTTQFYTIDQEHVAGSGRLIGGMQDNANWFTDTDVPTTSWKRLGGGDGAYCYFDDSARTQYYSSQEGKVYRIRLTNDGTETDRSRVDPVGGKEYVFINPYVLHPKDSHVMYTAGGRIMWRNKDLRGIPAGSSDSTAVNWDSLVSTNIGSDNNSRITAVMATSPSGSSKHVVYYGTNSGRIYKLANASIGQPVPTDITGSTMPRGATVNSISVDPSNTDHLVLCFSNYGVVSIWESQDAGSSWKAISGNLEEQTSGSGNGPAVNWAAFVPYDATTTLCVAATSTGMYFTSNVSGMSTVWTQTGAAEIGNVPCDMVVARASDKQIAVATHGRGTFTGNITTLAPKPVKPPTLASPLNGKGGVLPDTLLRWNGVSDAEVYQVNVWVEGDASKTITFEGVKGTSVSISGLVQGPLQYSWNVEAFNSGGTNGPSETWTFETAVRSPALYLPSAGASGVVQAMLTWERVPRALTYGVEVAPNAGFNPIVSKQDAVADTSILVRGLENNKRYFWRVRSADNNGSGLFSDRQSFVTGILSSVDIELSQDISIIIEPNPASDVMRICIAEVLKGASSTLRVTDAQGRTVQTLKIEDCTNVSASSLASGTYTVNVQGNGRVASAQFVVKR